MKAVTDIVKDAPVKHVGTWWDNSREFLTDVRQEMKRVSWPSRKEVYATTVVVILTSIFFGVYLWGIDMLLNSFIGWVFRMLGAKA